MNTLRPRYDLPRYLARHARRRALRRDRPWLIGHAAVGAAMLGVATARADDWQTDTSAWAGGVSAALRGQVAGDRPVVDPDQAIDIIVVRSDAAGDWLPVSADNAWQAAAERAFRVTYP